MRSQEQKSMDDSKSTISFDQDEIIFEGKDAAECDKFIRTIRKQAFAAGKQHDNEWIADLAAPCFSRNALVWYEGLGQSVQTDWAALRKALLSQYILSDGSAAPVPPPYPSLSIPSSPGGSTAPPAARVGRIRLIRAGEAGAASGYVKRTTTWFGFCKTTTNISEALCVRYTPSDGPHNLKLMNPASNYDWLGATWALEKGREPILGQGSDQRAHLAAVKGSTPDTLTSSSHNLGPTLSEIWNVSSDGTLIATWLDPEGISHPLDVAIMNMTSWIFLVSDYSVFAACSGNTCSKAHLVFEAL